MNFAQPYWLLAGLAACLFLLWRYRAFNRQQRAALARFVSPRLFAKLTATVSARRRRLKQGVFIAGIACLFVALARPQIGFRWEEAHRKGIELLVAVDTSKSMLTEDVKPDRLDRTKLAVNDLVNNPNGDGIGLLAFAGDAFLQCPITLDYDAFRESLDSLDTSTIPRGGTDIGGAIREAQSVLDARPGKEKILVLITDGEDLGGDAVVAAQAAAKDGMKIFTVGVGTAAGDLIPVPDPNGGTDFVKDSDGQFVKSRLDEPTLKQIAAATGGMYEPLGQQGQGLTAIYDQGLAPFTRHDLASRRTKVYLERFQWPLLAGLLCFASELLIGARKRVVPRVPARAAATVALALFVLPAASHASPASAEKAYDNGHYSLAEQEYADTLAKEAKQPKLDFNLGSAAYKSGDYAQAAAAFQKTLNTTEVPVQQNAYYNLGNTQYRVGQATEKASPQDTIKIWERAVQSYDAALQIKTDDTDAKFNRDLVEKQLEQLKKQQQQKQQQQNQQNKDQQQNQQSQNNQSQQNSGQSKNQNQSKPDRNNQGQGQQAQNQPGQKDQKPGQQQDQQNQQAQQNQQPANAGSQNNEKQPTQPGQQSAQAGQPQSPKPEGQKTDATGGQPQNQPAQAAQDAPDEPGQLTKEEANQLLDSLKGNQHSLAAAQLARGPVKPQDNQPLKDW
jgi:Ca-activated chloride channel family protein